jgi:hypothetical protein
MPEYRLKTAGQVLEAAVYFTISEAEAAAQRLANSVNKAVTVVEQRGSRSPPRSYRRNPYGIATGLIGKQGAPRGRYSTRAEAMERAQDISDDTGELATVFDLDTYPRAKSIAGSTKPAKKRKTRVAVEVEKGRAPANKARTVARKKTAARSGSTLPSSKLMGLASFLRNPSARGYPLAGEYYFEHAGKFYTSRKLGEIQAAAQHLAERSGKRVKVYQEDYSRDAPHKYTTKMRRNPVEKRFVVDDKHFSTEKAATEYALKTSTKTGQTKVVREFPGPRGFANAFNVRLERDGSRIVGFVDP